MNKAFNLRVYALIINDKNEILLSDEYRFGKFFTKFPGGGVEFGEGILDALHREMFEELNLKIDEAIPFYFNDFHQESAFQWKNHIQNSPSLLHVVDEWNQDFILIIGEPFFCH